MKSGWGQWLLVVGLSLVLAGSYLTWRTLRGGPLPAGELPTVTEMRDEQPLPAFLLRGPKGEFGNAHLMGRWSFVFFGYTQCPDICPTALGLMKEVTAAVAAPAAAQGASVPVPQVVFVSVDPRRDSQQLIGDYLAAFDPGFIGLRGDDAALEPLTKALGVYFRRHDAQDVTRYTVDHTAAIYLIDPRGRLRAVFSPPQEAAKVAANYRRIALP